MEQQNNCLAGPLQIVLNITNRCNLNCLHCFNNSSSKCGCTELTDEEFMRVVQEICTIKPYNVCFSGGEPLIREKLLLASSEALSGHGIRISLVSNGILLNEDNLQSLINAGVREVSISLDGIRQESHDYLRGKAGAFSKALNALKLLKKHGKIYFEPAFTVTGFNADEFENYVEYFDSAYYFNSAGNSNSMGYSGSAGYSRLIVRPMVLSGRALEYKELLVPTREQYAKVWKIIYRYRKEGRIIILFSDPLSHIYAYIGRHPFYGIEMQADGGLIPSPYIPFRLGDIRRHRIQQYWDAGLPDIWSHPIMKRLVSHMRKSSDISVVYEKTCKINAAGFDLIDNNYGQEIVPC